MKIPWNQTHETLLKRWDDICTVRTVMHTKAARYYEVWYYGMSSGSIIFMGFTAITAFSQSNSCNSSDPWILVAGMCAIMGGILSGIKDFVGFNTLATSHRDSMAEWHSTRMMLQEVASFEPEARNEEYPVRTYFKKMRERIQTLQKAAPNIPDHILARYIGEVDYVLRPQEQRLVFHAPELNKSVVMTVTSDEKEADEQPETDQTHALTDFEDDVNTRVREKLAAKQKTAEQYQLHRLDS